MWKMVAASAGANLLGAKMGADSAEDAANAQTNAINQANALSRSQNNIARADSQPFRDAGTSALEVLRKRMGLGSNPRDDAKYQDIYNKMVADYDASHKAIYGVSAFDATASAESRDADLARIAQQADQQYRAQNPDTAPTGDGDLLRKFTLEDFEADPVTKLSMQFGLDEGNKALRRTLGASGMARSGAAVKALTKFNSDYAGSKAGESRNRFVQDQDLVFNRLSGVAGTGQTATQNTAALGANMATNVGQNIVGAGNARGAAAIAGGNAMTGALNSTANAIQTKYLIDGMRTPQPSFSAPSAPRFAMDNAYENFA